MLQTTCQKHCKQPEPDSFASVGEGGFTSATKGLRNIETVKQKQKAFRGGEGGSRPFCREDKKQKKQKRSLKRTTAKAFV